ncbi:HK97-gp10 family putative phage morphogenesis protein [Rhizobium ruizarguesonis]|uniref:HK97-gp10 family putative phage morphogenesis protein n=1 Tax=Rhizobium ruizarguesonis TaxID=2081791 RepID=UPI00102F9ACF|nr:HK97-gp10 family putative phage morphogenesis protein [Rhizobium ruizarguesonis]TAZ76558.1 HK97 gp10 family phage protein [Rhizobium ruizarguesonis]TBA03191.1 HK97 gp10 family phage protein [Rhizobium ruizarguesonis]
MRTPNGLAKLQKRLAAIPAEVKVAVQPALLAAANQMAADMKSLVPVDHGDLRDSIEVTPAGSATPSHSQPGGSTIVPENAVMITAGNDAVRYPHLVEFGAGPHINGGEFAGTQNPGAPAQPFFFPAYRINRKRAAARVKRAISRAVKGR